MAETSFPDLEIGEKGGTVTNRRSIRIEWGDCDPSGIVYFPRYLEYCDAATNALFEKAGLFKPMMLKLYGIAGYPMVDVRARYLMPSEYGDTLEIESQIAEWGRSSFLVHHRLLKTGLLAAEVYERRVWVTRTSEVPARFKGQPIPQEVKDIFSGHLSQR